ncbi:CDP-diacylglycerol--glycerol-3-phosphate 3-phosphatidyltransferase 1, chloroplastic-like isoform X3 [Punica granatum]|uniref:CDP-diacylglycerol--glycerol-3-phosphate 3-phosphatidyltransferase 1, chloroplastic-like isoform X3 n=1 Tax=Punica granatum TaxID=22663 RepID=A0A6P8BZ58_PUNGR|nr:CDP-diacylglycerol--glycerol-3-phosphate 3-phosphatidyltransferase 1, chloroplastic-like isoform X3 [Punica granatum]
MTATAERLLAGPLRRCRLRDADQNSIKVLTLPTILTLGRVAAVPLFISTFYMDSWWITTAMTSIFIAAAITDWLDGYLARKMRLGSAFGAFLDPVADKYWRTWADWYWKGFALYLGRACCLVLGCVYKEDMESLFC